MFASKIAKPPAKAAADWTGKAASLPSGLRTVQAKLVVGSADDPLEHEADRVAEQVMRMPASAGSAGGGEPLGRTGGAEALQRKCTACEDAAGATAPAMVADVLRASGGPLDAGDRAFFEPRFGRDFSQIRVHSDDRAASSARSIGARAYTVGGHIAFAQGQYAPGSDHGRHLLAHELTHTIQQGAARVRERAPTKQGEETSGKAPDVAAGPPGETLRRSTTWKAPTVHETKSAAEIVFGGSPPVTLQQLNGAILKTDADADGAIKVPGIKTQALPGKNPAEGWMAKVDTVPAQVGSDDQTVLRPGPWTKVVTKAEAGKTIAALATGVVTNLAACTGTAKSTFAAKGNPNDTALYKANRRHEDHHVADDKAAFEDKIGKWDKKLQAAKTAGTQFTGSSAADATAKLWKAMGNTPKKAARAYNTQSLASGGAYHKTLAGGAMEPGKAVCNKDCSTSDMEILNPA